jgi:hypothetical protein
MTPLGIASQHLARLNRRLALLVRGFVHEYSTLLMVSLLYGTAKLLGGLFLQATFAGYGPAFGPFQEQGRFALGGAYPFIDYWMEYPPVFPWMNVAAYLLSIHVPGDQMLWYGTLGRWVLLPFDIGGVMLIYLIARRLGTAENHPLRASLLYMAAFVSVYVPLGWFDSLPLFWLLLTVYLAIAYRPGWSGIAAGLGFLTKPLPTLALPMAWQRFSSNRSRIKLTVAALLAILVPVLPFALANGRMLLAYLWNLTSRASYETIWALIDGYHNCGVVAPLESRFDPSSADWAAHPGSGSYGLWTLGGFAILYLFLWTRRIDWQNNRRAVGFVGLTWCLFCLWSKGYSPQWAINLVAFVALLMPTLRGAVYLTLLAVGLVAEWPGAFVLVPGQQWYLDSVIIWRTALTLLLTLEFGTLVLADAQRLRKLRRVYSVVAAILVLTGLAIGIRATREYFDLELTTEPLRSTISLLQSEAASEAGLICREVEVCERIAPYVPIKMHWVPSPESWQAEKLVESAAQHTELWYVEQLQSSGGHDLSVERWLSERYGKASQDWVGGTRVARFVNISLPEPEVANVQFADQILLSGYALRQKAHYLNVLLVWKNTEKIDVAYKPFIHILDDSGEIIAQNDQYPVGDFSPPNEWLPNSVVRDMHGLILPEDTLKPCHIRVGWYDPETGERLIIRSPGDLRGKQFFEIQIKMASDGA